MLADPILLEGRSHAQHGHDGARHSIRLRADMNASGRKVIDTGHVCAVCKTVAVSAVGAVVAVGCHAALHYDHNGAAVATRSDASAVVQQDVRVGVPAGMCKRRSSLGVLCHVRSLDERAPGTRLLIFRRIWRRNILSKSHVPCTADNDWRCAYSC